MPPSTHSESPRQHAAWPYLVPAHVCFYMTHMVQEHFDIHAKAVQASKSKSLAVDKLV